MADFARWWFEQHWLMSSVLTPFFTVLWLTFTDDIGWRIVWSGILWLGYMAMAFGKN